MSVPPSIDVDLPTCSVRRNVGLDEPPGRPRLAVRGPARGQILSVSRYMFVIAHPDGAPAIRYEPVDVALWGAAYRTWAVSGCAWNLHVLDTISALIECDPEQIPQIRLDTPDKDQ